MKTQRLNAVLDQMRKDGIDQMLVSDSYAIFYLTGKMIHPGERLLALYLNVNGNHKMFINELFPVNEDLGLEMVWFNDTQNAVEIVANNINKTGTIGIDKNWPAKFLLALMDLCKNCKFVNSSYIVDTLRSSKDEEEKDLMRKASALNDEAMKILKSIISDDLTEKQLANKLAGIYEDLGADGFSFSPIIGFGPNGADPHGTPGDRKVKVGDSI
ncbi:MAG: aminopeptidase P family N-terminal domain-containing protein, partial [Paeniclostridium sordellii]|nr:aminopeptidase P family N-terminal domain-containing protein [Paeniclostridium sordellii]